MAAPSSGKIDTVMQEDAALSSARRVRGRAPASGRWPAYEELWNEAAGDIETFWGKLAGELHWFKPFRQSARLERAVRQLVRRRPDQRLVQLPRRASDRPRQEQGRPDLGRRAGRQRACSPIRQLHHEVCQFANVLKKLGVSRGDVVSIYMPMVPELVIAMLACAGSARCIRSSSAASRAEAIADRNNDAQAKLVHHGRRRLAARASNCR